MNGTNALQCPEWWHLVRDASQNGRTYTRLTASAQTLWQHPQTAKFNSKLHNKRTVRVPIPTNDDSKHSQKVSAGSKKWPDVPRLAATTWGSCWKCHHLLPLPRIELGPTRDVLKPISNLERRYHHEAWVKHCTCLLDRVSGLCSSLKWHVLKNIDEYFLLMTTALKTFCLSEYATEAPYVLETKDVLQHNLFDILMSYGCDSD